MSANIYWQPVKRGRELGIGAPSSWMEKMVAAFGEFPLKLKASDDDVLRGLEAAGIEGIKELREILMKHDFITVWAEW